MTCDGGCSVTCDGGHVSLSSRVVFVFDLGAAYINNEMASPCHETDD